MQYWTSTINLRYLFFLSFVCLYSTFSFGQENSPYTRYALGNAKSIESIINRLMGGVAIADNNPVVANPTNPATYASLRLTSYQLGFDGTRNNIRTLSGSNQTGYATITYATVGIAAGKHFGFCFGLLPQFNARYNMQKVDTLFGKYERTNNYYGSGNVQRIFLGAAYKYNNFSIGLNTGYTFGSVLHSTEADYVDTEQILFNNHYGRTILGGLYAEVGALYEIALNKKHMVKIGATYTLAQTLRGNNEEHYETFVGDLNNPVYNYKGDSTYDYRGNINLPSRLALGVILNEGDHWQVGADFITSDWSQYRNYGMSDSTGASWYLKLGGGFTPDINANNNFWKKVTYRAGAYTGQDIYRFSGISLKRSAFTAGMGLPIRRTNMSIGQLNAGFEIGSRGTTDNGLLKENFTRFLVGIVLNDKWFIRRRYE